MGPQKSLVDLKFATSQLGGNTELLYRMLAKFREEFASVPAQVTAFLASENLKEAKLKVHTTKGLSGNLGLTALFECSKVLDQQIRDDQVQQSQVDEFGEVMRLTCEHIENLENATEPLAESTPKYDSKSSQDNFEYLDVFLTKLNRNEFIDDDTLRLYINSLELDAKKKAELQNYVEELQYANAISILESLA